MRGPRRPAARSRCANLGAAAADDATVAVATGTRAETDRAAITAGGTPDPAMNPVAERAIAARTAIARNPDVSRAVTIARPSRRVPSRTRPSPGAVPVRQKAHRSRRRPVPSGVVDMAHWIVRAAAAHAAADAAGAGAGAAAGIARVRQPAGQAHPWVARSPARAGVRLSRSMERDRGVPVGPRAAATAGTTLAVVVPHAAARPRPRRPPPIARVPTALRPRRRHPLEASRVRRWCGPRLRVLRALRPALNGTSKPLRRPHPALALLPKENVSRRPAAALQRRQGPSGC